MSQCGRLCSTHQDRLIYTNNVDVEWVEDFQIPKSFYSRPTPGRENFVRGCKEYSIPADPRKKITGFRRDYFPVQNLELRRQVQLAKEEERKRIQEHCDVLAKYTFSKRIDQNFICQTAMLTRMLYIHEFSFNTILMMTMQSIWRSPLAFPVALTN